METKHPPGLLHPLWPAAFAGAVIAMGLYGGPLFYDDAYITFRYAEHLAAGQGFVWNQTPVLGTTAPLYCLLLALLHFLGLPMIGSALGIGLIGGAAAPILIWWLGRMRPDHRKGFFAAALTLALFPRWWQAANSGMETTLASSLALLSVILDLKKKSLATGVVSGLLVLTRPDAATLPAILFIVGLIKDRKHAAIMAVSAALTIAPWVAYSTITFGSPLPQSLAAKKLIHSYPVVLALGHYIDWFLSFKDPPAMVIITVLATTGFIAALLSRRHLLPLALWPSVFITGLAFTRVGPFTWYKFPAVPATFAMFGVGLQEVSRLLKPHQAKTKAAGALILIVPAAFIIIQLIAAFPWLSDRARLESMRGKETIFKEMAEAIKNDAAKQGLPLDKVKVFAGEVGVIGYELPDTIIIDSAGINSPEVYAARLADWRELKKQHPEYTWKEKWWGSERWVREVIETENPDYIASDVLYLHLGTLIKEPSFAKSWRLVMIRPFSDGAGKRDLVLFARAADSVR